MKAVLVRRFDPVQIRKNPAAGRTSKPRGQETDMEVAFIARGIPAHYSYGGRGAVSRNHISLNMLNSIWIYPLRPVFRIRIIIGRRRIYDKPSHVSQDSKGLGHCIDEVVMPDLRECA